MARIKFKQICVGQYTGVSGRESFVVMGLSEEGYIYQFKSGRWQSIEEMFGSPSQSSEAVPLKSRPRSKSESSSGSGSGENDDFGPEGQRPPWEG